jgi:tRNA (guanine37-N1)-methyltransferase
MKFDILTIFPDLLNSPLQEGIIRRALLREQVAISVINLRDYAEGPHSMTDDRPFGGGEGMVMKPEPLGLAVKRITADTPASRVILLSPQGRTYNQAVARELAEESRLILVCGRYEGVDERFIEKYVNDEISIGDFVLTGGELAALVLIDSIVRLLPGVLGCSASAENDSFSRGLLKHPQYTRPREYEGLEVPGELLSGNHEKIVEFRFISSVKRTLARRPELLRGEKFSPQEIALLRRHGVYEAVRVIQES